MVDDFSIDVLGWPGSDFEPATLFERVEPEALSNLPFRVWLNETNGVGECFVSFPEWAWCPADAFEVGSMFTPCMARSGNY